MVEDAKEVLPDRVFVPLSCMVALTLAMVVFYTTSRQVEAEVQRNATDEARFVVGMTNGFIRTYADYQARFPGGQLPNPAAFRADALHRVDQRVVDYGFSTSVVGLPGREIAKTASDDLMRQQLLNLSDSPQQEYLSSLFEQGDETIHRTLWSFVATEPACVECHNRLQDLSGGDQWQLGEVMGAQVVSQNITKPLSSAIRNAGMISMLVCLTLITVSYCCLCLIRQVRSARTLKRLAATDPMTGCINRREMYQRMNRQSECTQGALLMLDLDRFKSINDTYGHAAGDAVLQDFSGRIKCALRSDDWVARIGGEEFVVWLPDIPQKTAPKVAERMRRVIESNPIVFGDHKIQYTVSIGLHYVNDVQPGCLDSWMKDADRLLYRAKSEGRNRVVCQFA